MIIISAGLPKSGSTLICNCQESMIRKTLRCGQEKLYEKFNGRFIGYVNWIITIKLIYISLRYGNIVIKTHSAPTLPIRLLISIGLAKATFTVRDPRDIVLSAVDHSKREYENNPFQGYKEFENALIHVRNLHQLFLEWQHFSKVYMMKYEDFMQDLHHELSLMNNYLDLPIPSEEIQLITKEVNQKKQNSWNFNKGTTNRYQIEMADEELRRSNEILKEFIDDLSYQI